MARVLLVGKGEPERGGIPAFLHQMVESDLRSRHDLTFLNLATHSSTGSPGGRLTTSDAARTLRDAVAVWRAAAGQDVVHLHTALAPSVTAVRAAALAFSARARGCAVIVHVHGGRVPTWVNGHSRCLLVRLLLAPAQRVVAVSESVAESLSACTGPARVRLLDNGVDVEAFSPVATTGRVPRILFVGLLTSRKGVLDLFDASRRLTQEGVDHELVLVSGTSTEGDEAERAVRSAAPPNARLLGGRSPSAMPSAYHAADLFCLPSWWEAMPLSVLEAMASGLPVVASDVGDVARLVEHGVNGLLVPARDPVRLAAELSRLLRDPDTRSCMGMRSRQKAVADFSNQEAMSRIGGIYDELEAARR